MKRLLILLIAVLLIVPMCSCSAIKEIVRDTLTIKDPDIDDTKPYQKIEIKELTYSEGYTPVTSTYSYDALPLEGEKALYHELAGVCYDISPEYSEEAHKYPMPEVKLQGYSLSEAQVRTVLKALSDDRPEFFWSCGTVGYYSDPESTIVQMYSRYSPEEVGERLGVVRAAADGFYASVPDGLTAYERERVVYDYLIDNTAYDEDVDTDSTENNDPDIYTVYGALVNRVAVCEGYARSVQMLLNGLGVDCICVTGYAGDELHMWNEIRLGDEWYACDVTWDDREESYARYCFFNLTSEQMGEDHTLAPMFSELSEEEINGAVEGLSADVMNLTAPECTDSTMSRYYRECPHLSDYDGVEVKNALYAAALKYDEYFVFYIDDALDYDEATELLFREYPQYFFSYVNSVNGYLEDYSIDSTNVGYIRLSRNRAVVIELIYY